MTITNSAFLERLLDRAVGYGWVLGFHGNPGSTQEANWHGRPYLPSPESGAYADSLAELNSYYSVAELAVVDGGRARRKAFFSRLRALVVDDTVTGELVGDPTYILETSPGKVQVGVFIDPDDQDAADVSLVSEVMSELYRRKLLGDSSGNNLVRYVRLPVGTNQKPRESGHFKHRMLAWNPGIVYSLEDACGVFGIDLERLRGKAKQSTDMVLLGDGQDAVLAEAFQRVVTGEEYHESLNKIAASMVASGAAPGAIVNLLRGVMSAAQAPRDDRWGQRYADIPRAVQTAVDRGFASAYTPPPLVAGTEREKQPLLVKASDLIKSIKPVDWLIKGMLEAGAMSVIYGPPGVGKSFLAFEMACCIATGAPFFGKAVKKGPVVIVAGEGQAGIARRLAAWSKARGVSLEDAELYTTTRAVPVLDRERALELVEDVDKLLKIEGDRVVTPAMVLIDTLARNFGPGDENSTKDMNAFVATLDQFIRERYQAHVQVVHHSGHDASRERGSSALRAALDQMFAVSPYQGGIKLSNHKMKDGPKPEPLIFKLETVQIGVDARDDVIESAALTCMSDQLDEVIRKPKSGPVTVRMMLSLANRDGVMPGVETAAATAGINKNTMAEIYKELVSMSLLEPAGDGKTINRKLTKAAMLMLSSSMGLIGDDEEVSEP